MIDVIIYILIVSYGEVDIHYSCKENQLFPFLEKHGWNGPSQGMWAFHDSNRDLIRNLRKKIETKTSKAIELGKPVSYY